MPTSRGWEYNRRFWPEYAAAIAGAGGEVVELSLGDEAGLKAKLGLCAGFVLPGSPADVDPALYGAERQETTAAADATREACDRAVLEHAAVTGKPVLAICFGMQFLNASLGGELTQDLRPVPLNHAAGSGVAVAHAVWVERASLLASLLGASEAAPEGAFRRLAVNSSHHQAVALPGHGMTVVARATEDGVVEAIEGRVGAAEVLGVQWHPERSCAISAASRALFGWLVCAAADAGERVGSDGF